MYLLNNCKYKSQLHSWPNFCAQGLELPEVLTMKDYSVHVDSAYMHLL